MTLLTLGKKAEKIKHSLASSGWPMRDYWVRSKVLSLFRNRSSMSDR